MMIYYINDNNIKYSNISSNSEDNKNICNIHKEDIINGGN